MKKFYDSIWLVEYHVLFEDVKLYFDDIEELNDYLEDLNNYNTEYIVYKLDILKKEKVLEDKYVNNYNW